MIPENISQKTIEKLISVYGDKNSQNINKCIKAVASRWVDTDGSEAEFHEFCTKLYIDNQSQKNQLFEKLQNKIEKNLLTLTDADTCPLFD